MHMIILTKPDGDPVAISPIQFATATPSKNITDAKTEVACHGGRRELVTEDFLEVVRLADLALAQSEFKL